MVEVLPKCVTLCCLSAIASCAGVRQVPVSDGRKVHVWYCFCVFVWWILPMSVLAGTAPGGLQVWRASWIQTSYRITSTIRPKPRYMPTSVGCSPKPMVPVSVVFCSCDVPDCSLRENVTESTSLLRTLKQRMKECMSITPTIVPIGIGLWPLVQYPN